MLPVPCLPAGTTIFEPADNANSTLLRYLHLIGHDPREALVWGTVSASFAVQAAGLAGLLAVTPAEAETRRAALRHRIDIREGRR